MKASFLCLAYATLISCSLLDPELPMGEPRRYDLSHSGRSDATAGATAGKDTVFLVSAISFPESYDWQRDSAFGAVGCSLLLFRDGKISLEVPAGPGAHISADPDKHHIIDGVLYTEYSNSKGTWIKKNGEDLISWKEPERLLGLLCKDGTVYSVGVQKGGGAICYRRDGQVVLKLAGAVAFGDFGDVGYGCNGALYMDAGKVCFAYKTSLNGVQSASLVRDGVSETVISAPGIDILDARQMDSGQYVLYNEGASTVLSASGETEVIRSKAVSRWQDGQIIMYRGHAAVAGTYIDYQGTVRAGIGWPGTILYLKPDPCYIYCDGKYCLGVKNAPHGHSDCYFFHRQCACQTGAELACVLTPKDPLESPFMEYRGKTIKFNVHGYLSGIAAEIIDK